MVGRGVRRRNPPEVEVVATRFRRGRDGRPPGEIVAHQLAMRTAPPREKAVRAAGVACDEHGGQRLVLVGRKRGVRAAPRQKTEEQVVVLPVGKVDRFPTGSTTTCSSVF